MILIVTLVKRIIIFEVLYKIGSKFLSMYVVKLNLHHIIILMDAFFLFKSTCIIN